jgi:hypothetical protein
VDVLAVLAKPAPPSALERSFTAALEAEFIVFSF